ncbi:DUF2231 domain-containing protein [Spongisporangium articulatum]|uniref:DUF2231 domain-containing protein n=1 Tax=Spongisporangium articulatum TaxID=3362603 RepID=A0ABW8APS7_9ACTN
MFDTIAGLPVHILVVHAAVVLVPLMALVTLAFTVRPKWRPGLVWAVLGDALCVVVSLVAKESGEHFEHRLGLQGTKAVEEHAEYGDKLFVFAVALLVAAVVAWVLVARRPAPGTGAVAAAVLIVVVAGVAATTWTVLTGDSGSRAVWEDVVKNTNTGS